MKQFNYFVISTYIGKSRITRVPLGASADDPNSESYWGNGIWNPTRNGTFKRYPSPACARRALHAAAWQDVLAVTTAMLHELLDEPVRKKRKIKAKKNS